MSSPGFIMSDVKPPDWADDVAWEKRYFGGGCGSHEPCASGCLDHPFKLDPESRRAAGLLFDEFFSSGLYEKTEHYIVEASKRFCESKGQGHLAWAVGHLLCFYEYDGSVSGFGGRSS